MVTYHCYCSYYSSILCWLTNLTVHYSYNISRMSECVTYDRKKQLWRELMRARIDDLTCGPRNEMWAVQQARAGRLCWSSQWGATGAIYLCSYPGLLLHTPMHWETSGESPEFIHPSLPPLGSSHTHSPTIRFLSCSRVRLKALS